MAMFYYKTFKVPMWAHVQDGKSSAKIAEWLVEKGARIQVWPGSGFKETVESFEKRGWAHVFEKREENGFIVIPPQLLGMAVNKQVTELLGGNAKLDLNMAVHRIDRKVRTDSDYAAIFDDVLKLQDSIVLSQSFKVGEICHDEYKKNRPQLWATVGDVNTQVMGSITDKLITIGEGDGFIIDLKKKGKSSLSDFLEEEFTKILEN